MTRTTLIIGGTGGIGSPLAKMRAAKGDRLFIVGRDADRLEKCRRDIPDCEVFVGDMRREEDARQMGEWLKEHTEFLSGVVHLCGSILLKPLHRTSCAEFMETLQQNLVSAFLVLKNVIPFMEKHPGASAVTVSSAAAQIGMPNHEAIAAAKAGLEGLTRSAAATYAASGLRFNAIAPGLVDTPLASMITKSEMASKASLAFHPLKSFGDPKDIASLIDWLLSDEAKWVSGQVWGIDGGLSKIKIR